jgi:hypothetical protein
MKPLDIFMEEYRSIQYPLIGAIQKNVLVNVVAKCNIEPGSMIDMKDALFESLEEDE